MVLAPRHWPESPRSPAQFCHLPEEEGYFLVGGKLQQCSFSQDVSRAGDGRERRGEENED